MAEETHSAEIVPAASQAPAHAHHDDETTTVFGITFPYPVYTVVFGALGVLTVAEVLIAEVMSGGLKTFLLLAIGVVKALLVMIFYMHLNTDNPLFRVAIALPILVASLSLMFLLAVPASGY